LRMIKMTSVYSTPTFDVISDDPAERLTALRDRALLAYAFASGGCRRSEVANLTLEMIEDMPPVRSATLATAQKLAAANIPSMRISLGRTKTTDDKADILAYLTGDAVLWLKD